MPIQTRIVRKDTAGVVGKDGKIGKTGRAGAQGQQGNTGAEGAPGAFAYTDIELPDDDSLPLDCGYALNWTENSGSGDLAVDNPIGTPLGNGHKLTLRIKSAEARDFVWDTAFRGSTDTALPTSTIGGGLTERWGFEWHAQDAKWDLVAYNRGH